MIARHRGDTRIHTRWRPAATAGGPPARARAQPEGTLPPIDQPQPRPRRAHRRIVVAAVAVVAAGAAAEIMDHRDAGRASGATLPATTRQWVDQWTSASLLNPAGVCGHLFAPALASAFRGDTGRSCTRYYNSIRSDSFRIRHILVDGPTAAVEAQNVSAGGYFTIVLTHRHDGWQAVDIVPG